MTHRVTSIDYVRLQWHLALPMVLGGFVAPNRRHWSHLVRRQSTAATYRVLHSIRKKYGPRTWSQFPVPSKDTLLVLDGDGIKTVLQSTDNFADPGLKKFALSCFTPSGVIVSRNQPPTLPALWSARRPINDHALTFSDSPHPDADVFASIIDDEVEQLLKDRPGVLGWGDFSTLAAKISQQVIFGRGKYCPYFEERVSRIVSSSNWGIARHHDLGPFFKRLRTELDEKVSPGGGHLVCRAAQWLSDHGKPEDAQPSSQVAFWTFVIKDAIELHTVRTLALIVQAPPAVQRRLRKEVLASGPPTAAAVDGMDFLEACVKEQLRLWTPVPILLRRAVRYFRLDDIPIYEGNWVLMHTGFYHRDPEVFGVAAHRFSPEERLRNETEERLRNEKRCRGEEPPDCSVTYSKPPLYVFSRYHQACAGQFLAIFLIKAVLAALLRRGPYTLLDCAMPRDAVPAAIDHFGLRFWWRRREPSSNPRARVL